MTILQQSFLVSNMCGEFMVCGHCECGQTTSNRSACGEESRVMFIEGVPPTALRDCLCCEAIKKEAELDIPAFQIDMYSQEASPLIRCKSGWNLPLKLYCVFLALRQP